MKNCNEGSTFPFILCHNIFSHNFIEIRALFSTLPLASLRSLTQWTGDPEGQGVVIPGEALSSGPWPEYLTPDWLIHIPGVEPGYMRCVRHGAQGFLSNSTDECAACLRREVHLSQAGGGGGGGGRGCEEAGSSERRGPAVHVHYQFCLWPPCQH